MNKQVHGDSFLAFREAPDPRLYVDAATHRDALTCLTQAAGKGSGVTLLTGRAGTGKTLLLRVLAARLGRGRMLTLGQNGADSSEPLRWILSLTGGNSGPAEDADLLARARKAMGPVLLAVDEAQRLDDRDLDQLRQLAEGEDGIPIILAGLPDLAGRLAAPSCAGFRALIAARCTLEPLTAAETAAYLAHRHVRHEGSPAFDQSAMALIHKSATGIPRRINQIAQQAIFEALAEGRSQIDAEFLTRCMRTPFSLAPLAPAPPSPAKPAAEPPAPEPAPAPSAPVLSPPDPPTAPPRRGFAKPAIAALVLALGAGIYVSLPRTPAILPPDSAPPAPALPVQISAAPDPQSVMDQALAHEATDPAQATLLYESAALLGDNRAAYYAGQLYETGLGVPMDLNRARGWYRQAGDLSGAQNRLKVLPEPTPIPAPSPATPLQQSLYPDGRLQLHWRGDAASFAVEYSLANQPDTVLRLDTDLSAALLQGPVSRWRILSRAPDGSTAGETGWIIATPTKP